MFFTNLMEIAHNKFEDINRLKYEKIFLQYTFLRFQR